MPAPTSKAGNLKAIDQKSCAHDYTDIAISSHWDVHGIEEDSVNGRCCEISWMSDSKELHKGLMVLQASTHLQGTLAGLQGGSRLAQLQLGSRAVGQEARLQLHIQRHTGCCPIQCLQEPQHEITSTRMLAAWAL